jgi:hypothetical protein
MKPVLVLTILCALAPGIAAAQDGRPKRVVVTRRPPPPADVVAPGVLRQDLYDRNNPNNLRHDYPAPPGLPG